MNKLKGRVLVIFLWMLSNILGFEGVQQSSGLHYVGCPDLQPSDFKQTVYRGHEKMIALEIAKDGTIYYTTLPGKVLQIIPGETESREIGKVEVDRPRGSETTGLWGIALDPDFPINPWIYLYYAPKQSAGQGPLFRLSRFNYENDTMVSASEKIILEIPHEGTWNWYVSHTGGKLRFDNEGNLIITTGDNSTYDLQIYPVIDESKPMNTALRTAGNTNDLRGKILRIHPQKNGSYTIPTGNLLDLNFFASLPEADKNKIRPEIYAMGVRNPIGLQYDPHTSWIMVSEAGPNGGGIDANGEDMLPGGGEEFNLLTSAANLGWPLFYGRDYAYKNVEYGPPGPPSEGERFDFKNPINLSKYNTGVTNLPPAQKAIYQWDHYKTKDAMGFDFVAGWPTTQAAAAVGPIYWYDNKLKSTVKMPPHLHGKMFISNFYSSREFGTPIIGLLTMNQGGDSIVAGDPLFRDMKFAEGIIDMTLGPQGEFYVLSYGNNLNFGEIHKIEYIGNCLPNTSQLLPGCINSTDCNVSTRKSKSRKSISGFHFVAGASGMGNISLVIPEGTKGMVRVFDLAGHLVFEQVAKPGLNRMKLPPISKGVYVVRVGKGNDTQLLRRVLIGK